MNRTDYLLTNFENLIDDEKMELRMFYKRRGFEMAKSLHHQMVLGLESSQPTFYGLQFLYPLETNDDKSGYSERGIEIAKIHFTLGWEFYYHDHREQFVIELTKRSSIAIFVNKYKIREYETHKQATKPMITVKITHADAARIFKAKNVTYITLQQIT